MELETSSRLAVCESDGSSTIRTQSCRWEEENWVLGEVLGRLEELPVTECSKAVPVRRGAEGAGYRYVAELVGGHPLAVGSRVALLHGSSDVDRLRTQDLGGGKQHSHPVSSPGTSLHPLSRGQRVGQGGGTCWLKLGTAACLGGVPMGTARTGGLPMTGDDERRGSARSEGSRSSSRACGGL